MIPPKSQAFFGEKVDSRQSFVDSDTNRAGDRGEQVAAEDNHRGGGSPVETRPLLFTVHCALRTVHSKKRPCGRFFHFNRLSLRMAIFVPTDWKICTRRISRITAISITRNL